MNKARLIINSVAQNVTADEFDKMIKNDSAYRDHLFCSGCDARVTFTKSHLRNLKLVDPVFRNIQNEKHSASCTLGVQYNVTRTGKKCSYDSAVKVRQHSISDMFPPTTSRKDIHEIPTANISNEERNETVATNIVGLSGGNSSRSQSLLKVLKKLIKGDEVAYIDYNNSNYDVINIADISDEDIDAKNVFWGRFNKVLITEVGNKKNYYLAINDAFKPKDGVTIQVLDELYQAMDEYISQNNKIEYFLLLTDKIKINTSEKSKNKFKLIIGIKSIICFA